MSSNNLSQLLFPNMPAMIFCFIALLYSLIITYFFIKSKKSKKTDEVHNKLIQSSKMAAFGEIAAGMAHEINNPLTIINGRIQKILELSQTQAIQKEVLTSELEKVLLHTERIAQIIGNLRKIAGKTEKTPFEKASVHHIIKNALDLCENTIKHNSVEIKLNLTEELFINCNPAQISQVIFHLINNSCDAISKLDEKWIQIETFKTNSNTIKVIVTDSGKGIPDEIAEKLMQPFFTTKDVGIGKGVDLSISHGIIREHQGFLTLDRKCPNTSFVIELPSFDQ